MNKTGNFLTDRDYILEANKKQTNKQYNFRYWLVLLKNYQGKRK